MAAEEVERLILAMPDLRHRAAFTAGLCVSETVAVKVGGIKSDRKCLHIPSGEGGAERMAPLPDGVTLDIAVIDVPALRLDHRNDRQRLVETVERVQPRLVILDPLVRLHGVDENAVADVAPILGFLRDIQRRFGATVLLVHHARKSGGSRPGQALRGSSELHAWGDSNLYLRRRDKRILMTVEHRDAPGLEDLEIELADDSERPALRLREKRPDDDAPEQEPAARRILEILAGAETPLAQARIRKRAALRNATVTAVLHELVREGRVERMAGGRYRTAPKGAAGNGKGQNGRVPDAVPGSQP